MPSFLKAGFIIFFTFIFLYNPYSALAVAYPELDTDIAGLSQIEEIFGRIVNISVAGAFIALLVVLIWAGVKFITSGGDSKALGQASSTITWGLLGILFLALAWLVLKLIAAFTGIDALTSFNIQVLVPPK